MSVTVRTSKAGGTRYYDGRTGTRIAAKEAHRREKIAVYAKRRFRDEAGVFRPRKVAVVARARPKEGKRHFDKEGREKYRTVAAVVEVSSEDEDEVLRALDEEEPDLVHFSVAGSEEVEE